MKHLLVTFLLTCAPVLAFADDTGPDIDGIVSDHILPRFEALSETSADLSRAAAQECRADAPELRAAYGAAFDAWIAASHLRFGPTEVDDRAFALAFWPDSRGATPRVLSDLIATEDAVAQGGETYSDVSIAARGFYALEFLLYDPGLSTTGNADYRCTLVRTITADIAATAAAILADWETRYADLLRTPRADGVYRTEQEALQEMFKAVTTGLQFTADTRLGRPLGTFERPRPLRAEARRSGRSARHVAISLASVEDLALRLATGNAALRERLGDQFARAQSRLEALDDPIFASVTAPQTRLKVEVIQQSVNEIRSTVSDRLGPKLGVDAGFNALDGD